MGIGSSGLEETPIALHEQMKSSNSEVSVYSNRGTLSFATNGARGEITLFTPAGRIIDRFTFGEHPSIDWNCNVHGMSTGVVIAMIKGVGSDGTAFAKSQRLLLH